MQNINYIPAPNTKLCLIVAHGLNYEIGENNRMPWCIQGDLKFFKEQTFNNCLIMGRNTFESIKNPLNNRRIIVVTSDINYSHKYNVECTTSLTKALKLAKHQESIISPTCTHEYSKIFIIGGVNLFNLAFDIVDYMYITKINAYFPNADKTIPLLKSKLNRFKAIAHYPSYDTSERFYFTLREQPKDIVQNIKSIDIQNLALNSMEPLQINNLSELENPYTGLSYNHTIYKRCSSRTLGQFSEDCNS